MVGNSDKELLRARLESQVKEALSPDHRIEALRALGPEATESAIVMHFIVHHGASFAKDWDMAMTDFNAWVTGISQGKEPDAFACYKHYVLNVPSEQQHHHRDSLDSCVAVS